MTTSGCQAIRKLCKSLAWFMDAPCVLGARKSFPIIEAEKTSLVTARMGPVAV
jgi:hypothetical protein